MMVLLPWLLLGVAIAAVFWMWTTLRAESERQRQLEEQITRLRGQLDEKTRLDEELVAKAKSESERIVEEAITRAKLEAQARKAEAEAQARQIELVARDEAQKAKVEAAEQALRARVELEAELRTEAEKLRAVEEERWQRAAGRLKQDEERLTQREQALAEKDRAVTEKEKLLSIREADVARRERDNSEIERDAKEKQSQIAKLVDEQRVKLEALAGLSGEEARKRLLEQFRDEARVAGAREAKTIEDTARDEAEKRAKRIIGIAIQRYAGDHVQERAVTSVHLASDELKGRIIGREGRNIRALQEATGVDFIVDDTPETIVVSSFDPVRREVARLAIERLIADGRIHPTRIEEVVVKAQQEVERAAFDAADRALDELGLTRLHPELVKLLGQLRYRFSYAQNVLKHSVECGYLTGLMASELGLNIKQARRAGLLHDIGKAVSHEVEGGHAVVGGVLARKHGEDEIVANAIACHHDEEPCVHAIGHLVTAADALSGARPGARREMLESYVRRLDDLERISTSFTGVERSYAIQAGREVRVIVEPSEVSDEEAALLAREISRRIEDELAYPGQVKVTVIRETRAVDYAK